MGTPELYLLMMIWPPQPQHDKERLPIYYGNLHNVSSIAFRLTISWLAGVIEGVVKKTFRHIPIRSYVIFFGTFFFYVEVLFTLLKGAVILVIINTDISLKLDL